MYPIFQCKTCKHMFTRKAELTAHEKKKVKCKFEDKHMINELESLYAKTSEELKKAKEHIYEISLNHAQDIKNLKAENLKYTKNLKTERFRYAQSVLTFSKVLPESSSKILEIFGISNNTMSDLEKAMDQNRKKALLNQLELPLEELIIELIKSYHFNKDHLCDLIFCISDNVLEVIENGVIEQTNDIKGILHSSVMWILNDISHIANNEMTEKLERIKAEVSNLEISDEIIDKVRLLSDEYRNIIDDVWDFMGYTTKSDSNQQPHSNYYPENDILSA